MASLDDYHLGNLICTGSFGAEVQHGQYKSDRNLHVSIKCVSKAYLRQKSPQEARQYGLAVVQEQKLLKRFSGNQCVPRLYACFHNEEYVVMVTQCCTGGSLEHVIQTLSKEKSNSWREHCALQLIDILVFLHTSSIIHCDLQPSVLHLTQDGNLRLVDLGYAVDLKQNNRIMIRHKSAYSSPELWNDEPTVSTAVDLWSAGCICFAMHAARSPFEDPDETDEAIPHVGERVTGFCQEYNESPNKRPKLLENASLGLGEWSEMIYELLHPDPLHRTQAAATDTSGDLYDVLRNRFLSTKETTFQPPVPTWLQQDTTADSGEKTE